MGLRFTAARAVSGVSTWGLKNVFHRPAANFPGKMALYVDPQLIAHLRGKLERGSVCVVGTNGKTTVSNLLADVLETSGQRVVCNRTGANLDSGVSTALLHAGKADWGVFECDELWLAKILPQLRANYVVLLNLFRDQLDRCGEIDRIQDSIVKALGSSPETVLHAVDRLRRGREHGLGAKHRFRRHDVPALLHHVRIRLAPIRPAGRMALPELRLRAPCARLRRRERAAWS